MSRLASYRVGDGERSTVLLHGFLGSGKNLRSLAQGWVAAEPSRRLVVPDLTGHGASPPLPPEASLATLADDVIETARAEGLPGPWSLVGHSLGGRVALAAARRAPDLVRAVTFMDIAPGVVDERHSGSRRVLDVLLIAPDQAPSRRDLREHLVEHGITPQLADWLVMNVRIEDGRARWTFDREALDRLQVATSAEDLWDVVTSGGLDLRCIRGGRSRYVSDDDAARLEAAGCPVVTLDSGHDLHVEALPALLAALTAGQS